WLQLPQAATTGCMLLVAPLGNVPMQTAGGRATFTLNMPNVPALAGASFKLQAIHLELGGGGALQLVTGSNGLEATSGML
ncbi:MAG: hypothetical protein KDC98_13050, partial [Planctomycetes bacterium]|nr:hypothetical protein [Planctomycetota bacterium]